MKKILYSILCLLFSGSFCLVGNLQAQNGSPKKRFSISVSNTPFYEAISQIEQQSGYLFLYKSEDVDPDRSITLHFQEAPLSDVMRVLLQGTGLEWTLSGRHITLAKAPPAPQVYPVTVSGSITDAAGEPVVGVSVVIKGRYIGVTSGTDGKFSISARSNDVLEFNSMGYVAQSLPVQGRTTINVRMEDDTQFLEEVVVIGYGTATKASLTGAVSVIKSEELTTAPLASTTNALAGRLPGLITKQTSGLPGSDGATLSIRGFDAPLVIVDGVEGSFNNIDANEIESISILKDASAAVYGARAGNGVILVTTKRGTIGKPTITLNSTLTFQRPTNLMRMASAGQYAEMVRESHIQAGQPENTSRFSLGDIEKYYAGTDPDYPSTDWFDFLIRDWAPQSQHNVSLRGGSDAIRYYGFVGFLDQQSMIKRGGGYYRRYNIRSNIDARILPNLNMSVDFSVIMDQRRFPWRSDEGNNSVWQDIWNTEPIYPAELPDPTKVPYANGGGTGGAHITSNRNLSGTRDSDNQTSRIQGSLRWDITQIPGLSAKYVFTLEKWYTDYKYFQHLPDTYTYNFASDTYTKLAKGLDTKLDQSASRGQNWQSLLSLDYQTTLAESHNITAQLLYELYDQGNSWISAGRSDFDTNMIPYLFAGGLANQIANGSAAEMGRASLIGRLNYNYKQKYLLEGTFRYDGSAKFAKGHRWGFFPSVSAAWRIAEEPFLKDNVSFVDNLKLRAGFSQTGNDAVANFNYLAGYSFGNIYNIGGSAKPGLHPTGIANPFLSWEEMTIYNAGIDFGLFRNRFFGEIDAFYRLREGIPGNRSTSLPDTFGASLPVENLNAISTRGFEVMLGYQGQIRDFRYRINGNISWARSKWDKYDEPDYEDPDDIRINKRTGKWTDINYGYKSNGLFTSMEQIEELPYYYMNGTPNSSFLHEGDVILLNTNDDNVLDWRDQQEIGKGSMPNWTGGLNIDFYYKGFDFSMLWQGAFGFSHQVVLKRGIVFPEVIYNERWTYENNNPNAIVPRLGGASTNDWGSDYHMIAGDYLRLKSLSLGYTLPGKWLQWANIGQIRAYVAATNLVTFSKLNKYNIDPEANSGAGGFYYPQMRTITFGLNISL